MTSPYYASLVNRVTTLQRVLTEIAFAGPETQASALSQKAKIALEVDETERKRAAEGIDRRCDAALGIKTETAA